MRLLTLLLLSSALLICASTKAADSIAPGMSLQEVVDTLENHGYGVGSRYQLQMISGNKNIDLEFCRIDDEITLILDFDKRTKKITSMSIYVLPENAPQPKAERSVFVREVLEMGLEPRGIYTLKLERSLESKGRADSD